MVRKGFKDVVACIDDFLVGRTYDECNKVLHELIRLVRRLGFFIGYDKVEGPSQCITFLGLRISTKDCTLSLGQDRLSKLEDQPENVIQREGSLGPLREAK